MSTNETVIDRFKSQIIDAKKQSTCVRIRGGGSKDFYGVNLEGEIVDTNEFTGITEYEPTELVLTARSGTPLKEDRTNAQTKTIKCCHSNLPIWGQKQHLAVVSHLDSLVRDEHHRVLFVISYLAPEYSTQMPSIFNLAEKL